MITNEMSFILEDKSPAFLISYYYIRATGGMLGAPLRAPDARPAELLAQQYGGATGGLTTPCCAGLPGSLGSTARTVPACHFRFLLFL